MDRNAELALIERCIAQYRDGVTTLSNAPGTSDVSRYTDTQRFEREMSRIHRAMPTPWLHCSELRDPDSFLRLDTVLGDVLFTRDADGRAHAFHNVCRHRGSVLLRESCGSGRITCPYHAWGYSTAGELLSVPAQDSCFPGLDKSTRGLAPLPCVEAYGFVWLCPDAANDEDAARVLAAHLGAMIPELEWLELCSLQVFRRDTRRWRANWKLLSEGGLEAYHFKTAHRDTIAPFFPNNLCVQDGFGLHSRMVLPSEKIRDVMEQPAQSRRLRDFTHTLFGVAPQTSFLAQDRHVDWIRMTPIAPDETEIVITSLVPGSGELDENEGRHWGANMDITLATLEEDFIIGEGIQRGLGSGANGELLFGCNEGLLGNFNDWVEAALAD